MPAGLVELLRPDSVRSERIGAGVWYRYLWSAEGPWGLHVVEADMSRCDLTLRTLRSEAREGGGRGHEAVTSMVARTPSGAIAAVNADFFTPEGTALGTEVVNGRVTVARERPAMVWRPGRDLWVGPARVQGDSLYLDLPLPLDNGEVADPRAVAVGGYPEILDGGSRVGDLGVSERAGFAVSRHPRTAVAYDPDSRRLWLVVVDGRQAPYSVGMSLPELAEVLEALGAVEALNLDGGGSSALVVHGELRNRPSDEAGERPVVNALALTRDVTGCSTARPSPP